MQLLDRRCRHVAVCTLAVLAATAVPALAQGTLDQTTLPANSGFGLSTTEGGLALAQTFTAGRSGSLDTVSLAVSAGSLDGRFRLSIRGVTAAGTPSTTTLASRTIDACRVGSAIPEDFVFGPAAEITASRQYAIVLEPISGSASPNNPTPPQLTWSEGRDYAAGAPYIRHLDGPGGGWAPPDPAAPSELGMATYVSETSPPALQRDATTTTITSEQNPAPPGSIAFTATVKDPLHPQRIPTGTVAFRTDSNGGTDIAPVDSTGKATWTAPNVTGSHDITAAYCPDTDAFESSAGVMHQRVVQHLTDTAVTVTPATSRVGEPVTITATVTNADDAASPPPGSVHVEVMGAFGSVFEARPALAAGKASVQTSEIPWGDHLVVVTYEPASGFFASSGTNTPQVTLRWPSTTAVTISPDPTVAGQEAMLTATVNGDANAHAQVEGSVQFSDDDGTPIGESAPVDSSGRASVASSAGAGRYTVHATYSGDDRFAPSAATASQSVGKADTKTTLTSTPNPAPAGSDITFVADVAVEPPGDVDLFGTLQFSADGAPIGDPIPLEGYTGVEATFAAPSTPQTTTITVTYTGDDNTNSSSASLAQVLTAPLPRTPGPAPTGSPTPTPFLTPAATATPVPLTPPSAAALKAMAGDLVRGLRRRGVAAARRTRQTLTVDVPGTLEQRLFTPREPTAATSAAKPRRPVVLARAARTFTTAGTKTFVLRLTRAGRQAVNRRTRAPLALVTRYRPASGTPVVAVTRIDKSHARASVSARWAPAAVALRGRPHAANQPDPTYR